MSLAELTREFAEAFETRVRDNGDKFVCLRDGAPEWMAEICHAAHGDMLPDDWRYEAISRIADVLADTDPDDWDDYSHEAIDGLVDIYNHSLLRWLASHGARVDYADDAAAEYCDLTAGIIARAQAGQCCELSEIWGLVTAELREAGGS